MDTNLIKPYVAKYGLNSIDTWEEENNAMLGQVKNIWKKGISMCVLKAGLHFEANSRSANLFGKLYTELLQIGDESLAKAVKKVAYQVWGVRLSIRKDKGVRKVHFKSDAKVYSAIPQLKKERYMDMLFAGQLRDIVKEYDKDHPPMSTNRTNGSQTNNIYQTHAVSVANLLTKVLAKDENDPVLEEYLNKIKALEQELEDYLASKAPVQAAVDKNLKLGEGDNTEEAAPVEQNNDSDNKGDDNDDEYVLDEAV